METFQTRLYSPVKGSKAWELKEDFLKKLNATFEARKNPAEYAVIPFNAVKEGITEPTEAKIGSIVQQLGRKYPKISVLQERDAEGKHTANLLFRPKA